MLTIGHSTSPIEGFLEVLRRNGVAVLVDIRTIPRSAHNPQFEQQALASSLAAAGLEYRWKRALGGLRHARPDSVNTGWKNKSFRGYADYMQTPEFARAIRELLEEASLRGPDGQMALMCAEATPWRCHRSLVSDALLALGRPVEHILYAKKAEGWASRREPHRLTAFARLEGERVWYPAGDDLFAALAKPG